MPRVPRSASAPSLRRVPVIAIMVAAALSLAPVPDAVMAGDQPPYNGKILLTAWIDREGDTDEFRLYTINPDGTGLKQLTSGHIDGAAEWSPDGTRIAFARQPVGYGPSEIWVMNADGSGQRQVTTSSEETEGFHWNTSPTWSPDASFIAFAKRYIAPLSNFSDIMRTPSDGAGDETPVAVGKFFAPKWSPDGTLIAYYGQSTEFQHDTGLFVSEPSGMNRQLLHEDFTSPADWSPDSNWILLVGDLDEDFDADLYRLSRDGNTVVEMSAAVSGSDFSGAVYSPDGTRLAFGTFLANGDLCDVRTANLDGASSFNVTLNISQCFFDPQWAPTEYPFIDVLDNTLRDHIRWAFEEGITTGCAVDRYCPTSAVTRAQMASFLSRALELPTTDEDFFSDDNGKTHETDINRLAAAGLTLGCAPGLYCPTRAVTRGEMATFLVRALKLQAATQDYFTDDAGTTHESNINRVREAGVAFGCTTTTYCPNAPVTRAQMAAFLHRAFP